MEVLNNIDTAMGEEIFPPSEPLTITQRKVVLDALTVPPQIQDLIDKLKRLDTGCVDISIDFKDIGFTATEEDMYITTMSTSSYTKPVYFKRDLEDSTAPKIVHAQKQFCRALGVPHGFFIKNRPSLRMNIVKTWQAGLQAEDKKSQYVLRLRDGQDCGIIRAILSPSFVPLKNSEVLLSIFHGLSTDAKLLLVNGEGQDDLIFHARISTGQTHTLATRQVIELGIALTASELGACPLFFDVFVRDVSTGAYFIVTYAGEPFFTSKYAGLQHIDVVDLLNKSSLRVAQETPDIITSITAQTAVSGTFEMQSEFHRLSKSKGLTSKIRQAMYHQMSEAQDQIHTPYDVACQASVVAQSLDILKRVEAERSIGKYLNLVFLPVAKG